MRSMICRGQRTEGGGGWVYGYYVKTSDNLHYIVTMDCRVFATSLSYQVNPATIGQLTPWKDKNGTPIYDGDALRCESRKCYMTTHVAFKPEQMITENYIVIWNEADAQFVLKDVKTGHIDCSGLKFESLSKYFTVTGNVTDDPELMPEAKSCEK